MTTSNVPESSTNECSVIIPEANPDVFTDVQTQCSIFGLCVPQIYVAFVVDDGSASPDPCSWRNTIYVENSSENDRSAAEVMVHGNFRCKIDVPTDLSSANFSFRLHSIPIKSMCSRELRIAVYADKTAVVPIVISRPFRNVAYKITMIHEPFLTAFPPSNGMYCYEEAKRPLVFKIALSSCSPDSVVPDVNVMLNLSIVDLKGSPRPDLTVNNPHDPAWWNVERENSSEGVSEYVSLPAILRCTLKISSPELVCIRVMVQSVSGAAMSPVEIGACDTSAFTIGALTAVEGLPPRNIPAEIMCSVDRTSNLNQLPIPAVMSTAVPAEFEGDGPKEKLMRWIHASMVALHTARSTKQFSDLNKELIFDALAKYHLLRIEECIDSLEYLPNTNLAKPVENTADGLKTAASFASKSSISS